VCAVVLNDGVPNDRLAGADAEVLSADRHAGRGQGRRGGTGRHNIGQLLDAAASPTIDVEATLVCQQPQETARGWLDRFPRAVVSVAR